MMYRVNPESFNPCFLFPGPRECVQTRRCNLERNGIEFGELPFLERQIGVQDCVILRVAGVYYQLNCVRSV